MGQAWQPAQDERATNQTQRGLLQASRRAHYCPLSQTHPGLLSGHRRAAWRVSHAAEADRDLPGDRSAGPLHVYDKLNDEISNYRLSLFNPSRYVLPQYRALDEGQTVGNFKQSDRESFLIGMLKVNFLKRLESSIRSFAITMERTVAKIEELEKRIARFKRYRDENTELDPEQVQPYDGDDEELRSALEVGKGLTFKMAHLDVDAWLRDLKRDREQLYLLQISARDVSVARDAKLAGLKDLIAAKVKHPPSDKSGQPNRKVLVFTAFADTAVYLYDAVRDWAQSHLPCRQMGTHECTVLDTRPCSDMKVWGSYGTAPFRMPVIGDDLSTFAIKELVEVGNSANHPGIALA